MIMPWKGSALYWDWYTACGVKGNANFPLGEETVRRNKLNVLIGQMETTSDSLVFFKRLVNLYFWTHGRVFAFGSPLTQTGNLSCGFLACVWF